MSNFIFFVSVFSIFYSGLSVGYAEMPKLMRYEGQITDSQDNPVPDGNYKITFRIYDEQGNKLWEEVCDPSIHGSGGVIVEKGKFNVIFGGSVPLPNMDVDKQYYVGVQVENDMEKRHPFKVPPSFFGVTRSS